MAHLTTLPNEILHNILQWLAPKDLESLPRVCKALHSFVNGNQKLCEDIYIHHFVSAFAGLVSRLDVLGARANRGS